MWFSRKLIVTIVVSGSLALIAPLVVGSLTSAAAQTELAQGAYIMRGTAAPQSVALLTLAPQGAAHLWEFGGLAYTGEWKMGSGPSDIQVWATAINAAGDGANRTYMRLVFDAATQSVVTTDHSDDTLSLDGSLIGSQGGLPLRGVKVQPSGSYR
jgi:hypothetical protein